MFLPALVAKFLSLGAVAQAASGVGIAVVAFTGAGATGMLGTNVQTTLTSVVGGTGQTTGEVTPAASPSASPTGTPTRTPTGSPAVQTPAVTTPSSATPAFDAKAWVLGPTGSQTFGEWVRQGAHNKAALEAAARARGEDFRFGQVVSSWARTKHVDLSKVQGLDDVEGDDHSTTTAAPTRAEETETEHATQDNHGNGRGNSGDSDHGGGKSDRGHSGD